MSRRTTNYGFNISEGTDLVNPLTDIFPNFESIDTDLKGVSDSAVGTATELLTGTVHALTRSDSDRNVFTFTATSNFEAGETFTLDGVQVTALTPDGQTLSTGCYIIGSEVLVAVKGTLMTVYVNPSKALDSDKLDGHDSTYFATASDVSDLSDDVSELSSKVGTGTLTVGNDCVDGINTLNTHLSTKASITQLNTKQNKKWNHIADSINGAQSQAYSLANYEEVKLCIYGTVNGTQLSFTESFPKEFVSSSRTLRGAGGYGTELDCYQISISSTGCRMDGIWANGTSILGNSLVQVYAR